MSDPTAPQSIDSAQPVTPVLVGGPTPELAVAPIPGVQAPAPQPLPDNSAEVAQLQQRLRDTQAWGHRKTEEARELSRALNEILNHPELGKVASALGQQSGQGTSAPSTGASDEIRQYLSAYKAATNEEEAFSKIIEAAESRSVKRLEQKLQEREAIAMDTQTKTAARDAITNFIKQNAQDVQPEYFWALAPEVEAMTPPEIDDPKQRINWQVQAGIQLARQRQTPILMKIAAGLLKNENARSAIGALMSPGTVTSMQTAPAHGSQPVNMVEQMKQMQAARMGLRK